MNSYTNTTKKLMKMKLAELPPLEKERLNNKMKVVPEHFIKGPADTTATERGKFTDRYKFVLLDNKDMPEKAQALLFDILNRIIKDTIAKFEKGQAEHGGNLLERNLLKDIHDESIDQLVYSTAMKIQRNEE